MASSIAPSRRDQLLHCLAKGSIVTWRLSEGEDAVELSDLNINGICGTKPTIVVPHPDWLLVYVVGDPPGSTEPAQIYTCSLTSERMVESWSGHHFGKSISQLVWVDACKCLVSGSADGTCRLWDMAGGSRQVYTTGRMKKGFLGDPPEPEEISQIAVKGKSLFVANRGGSIDVVDLAGGSAQNTLLSPWKERILIDVPTSAVERYQEETRQAEEKFKKKQVLKKAKRALGEDTDSDDELEELKVWGEGDPNDKSELAKRAGDHDNGVSQMVLLEGGAVAATTSGGEILVTGAKLGHHESLLIFTKSYGGTLAVGQSSGEARLFTGNRGYDAKKYEVVILSVDPLTQLRRIEFEGNSMVTRLHWSKAAGTLLVAQEDKGLYSIGPEASEPSLIFLSEEDPDSMDNEEILGFAEARGQVCARTTFGRVRRFAGQAEGSVKELEPLHVKRIRGIVGRAKIRVDRPTGTLISLRGGYDEYKLDVAPLGGKTWTRHARLPLEDNSGKEVEVVKDGEPGAGMGYPGKYSVKDQDGNEMTLGREEMGGLMHLKKGWPPAFLECLESPEGSMVLVGGELGGLIEYQPQPGKISCWLSRGFDGGRLITGCDVSLGATSACAAWDAEGTLIVVLSRAGSWVYSWASRALHGDLKIKPLSRPVRVESHDPRALVAAWQSDKLQLIDLRAVAVVRQLPLAEVATPRVFMSAPGARLFGFTATDAKAARGTLGVWSIADFVTATEASEDPRDCPITVRMGDTEAITSMALIVEVGLLTAHSKVPDGISVWDIHTGAHLYRVWPTHVGSSLLIQKGHGDHSILWSSTGGEVGHIAWNKWTSQMKVVKAEDGPPGFSMKDHAMMVVDAALFVSSKYQLISFCIPYVAESHGRRLPTVDEGMEPLAAFPWPDLFHTEPVQWAAQIGACLRWGMHLKVPYMTQLGAASGLVAMFALIFYVQEAVEARAYLQPASSLWPKVFAVMQLMVKAIVSVATLPLFTIFLYSAACDGDVLMKDASIQCGSTTHAGFVALSALSLLVLGVFTVRYFRVDQDLRNIDAKWNLFDVSGDTVPTTRTPKHAMSAMSRTYALAEITIKYAFNLVKRFCSTSILGGMLNCVLALTVCKLSLWTNPVPERQSSHWLQLNKILFAIKVGVVWIFVIWVLAALIAEGHIERGEWFNYTPLLVLVLCPLALFSRATMQRRLHRCWDRGLRGGGAGLPEEQDSVAAPLLSTSRS
jgi:hypothetical protein